MSLIKPDHPASTRLNSSVVNFLAIVLLVYPLFGLAQEQVIEVIQLSHRQASEMATLIRPFLDGRDTAVAHGTQLIVKASPPKMAEIRRLINQLDKGLARLQISVLQTDRTSVDELNARAVIHGGISNDGGYIRGRGAISQSNARSDGDVSQQIQALEGKAAHIQVGKAFPVPDYRISRDGRRYYPDAGVTYHQATTGFAVIPRLVGNEVLLEVAPWSDRLRRSGGGVVDTRSAVTTIRAPLGQWVEFGGLARGASGSATGLFQDSRRDNHQSMKMFIKVDKLE